MPQEINEAAMAPTDERYRVSVEAVLEKYKEMYTQTMYDLALSQAGVDQLMGESRRLQSQLRDAHGLESELIDQIQNLTVKLDEFGNINRKQGEIIERYRLVHGDPPQFVGRDLDDDPGTGPGEETVEDEVFSGKTERKAVQARKR